MFYWLHTSYEIMQYDVTTNSTRNHFTFSYFRPNAKRLESKPLTKNNGQSETYTLRNSKETKRTVRRKKTQLYLVHMLLTTFLLVVKNGNIWSMASIFRFARCSFKSRTLSLEAITKEVWFIAPSLSCRVCFGRL